MIWIVTLTILIAFMLTSMTVGAAMGNLGFILTNVFSTLPFHRAMGEVIWNVSSNYNLFAIPLYILLGQLLVKSGIAQRTYKAMDKWLSWLPGGLLHANIASSAIFAATSGSSVATAATMGTISLPECRRYGYNEGFFAASIAAGGTLGILIPPSINLIVYGFLTNTSIPKLFVAGIIPGLLLTIIFMAIIFIICSTKPGIDSDSVKVTMKERIASLKDLIPIIVVFIVVLGSIYTGLATPTESAALGVLVALGITAYYKKLTWQTFVEASEGTIKTTGMIMLILFAAYFLNFIFLSLGVTKQITEFIDGLGFSASNTLFAIILMYMILGVFIETLSMMALTIPVVHPIIISLGYDPIWFGVVMILLVEMALITPPVGLNLYVTQGVRASGSIKDIILWIVPFVLAILLMILLLIQFPVLALFLT
ncbi:MAG: TRAP transporter large permease [Desulfobulbaceae bacterium]|nr:TRAP transporter large permease [Desulfobulbaceae bacterium]